MQRRHGRNTMPAETSTGPNDSQGPCFRRETRNTVGRRNMLPQPRFGRTQVRRRRHLAPAAKFTHWLSQSHWPKFKPKPETSPTHTSPAAANTRRCQTVLPTRQTEEPANIGNGAGDLPSREQMINSNAKQTDNYVNYRQRLHQIACAWPHHLRQLPQPLHDVVITGKRNDGVERVRPRLQRLVEYLELHHLTVDGVQAVVHLCLNGRSGDCRDRMVHRDLPRQEHRTYIEVSNSVPAKIPRLTMGRFPAIRRHGAILATSLATTARHDGTGRIAWQGRYHP